jgi:hypothetical protein
MMFRHALLETGKKSRPEKITVEGLLEYAVEFQTKVTRTIGVAGNEFE